MEQRYPFSISRQYFYTRIYAVPKKPLIGSGFIHKIPPLYQPPTTTQDFPPYKIHYINHTISFNMIKN